MIPRIRLALAGGFDGSGGDDGGTFVPVTLTGEVWTWKPDCGVAYIRADGEEFLLARAAIRAAGNPKIREGATITFEPYSWPRRFKGVARIVAIDNWTAYAIPPPRGVLLTLPSGKSRETPQASPADEHGQMAAQ